MLQKPDSCKGCPLYSKPCGKPQGFVPPCGSGDNGVLVILEYPGEHEEIEAMPSVGKAGYFLWQNLKRIGIEREGFRIQNVISCMPPNSRLFGQWYEQPAITNCAPNLCSAIAEHVAHARSVGRTPVVLTLGPLSFKQVMGDEYKLDLSKYDYLCYPHWNQRYQCFVVAADHPNYLMRGQTHLLPVMQFAFQRALEIASDKDFAFDIPKYIEDPSNAGFANWIDEYEKELEENPEGCFLSYDIETPHKKGTNEEDLAKDEDDYVILRCAYAYNRKDGSISTCSNVWSVTNINLHSRIFASRGPKLGWNSQAYDDPRIIAQTPINGVRYDAMQMWHVLNSALPKGLGFVTPFYVFKTGMWKHMSDAAPAFYNAKDADMALQIFLGVRQQLVASGQWEVYYKHVVEVHKVFNYMSDQGVRLDLEMRAEAEKQLSISLEKIKAEMEDAVPSSVKKLKIYKKLPKALKGKSDEDIQNLGYEITVAESKVKECPVCGLRGVSAPHFKSIGKKRLKLGELENPCAGSKPQPKLLPTRVVGKRLDFKISKLGLFGYQKAMKHISIVDRKKKKATYDEKAILKLISKYPKDRLYPLVLEHRKLQKLLGTYIGVTNPDTGRIKGGLPTGNDGRVHTMFTSNPSTLRSASQNPNLQNIPRPSKDKDDPANIIRNLFVAAEGSILLARDYSGIEAKLVGYFASAPHYMRLCAIDVHSFYTAYALNALDGRVSTASLPQLSWSDTDLKLALGEIKTKFKEDRNNLYKHLVHAINFGQSARGAQEKILAETGIAFPLETIQKVMDLYKDLFPEIPKWHQETLLRAEKDGFLKNPFGYVHRFTRPFEYERDENNKWTRKQGPDANKCWAFLPQSSAAGIIKEAMLRLFQNRFEEAGQYLRLLIHDELFQEVPSELVENVDNVLTEEMEKPIQAMPLRPEWGQGDFLMVGTEGKKGKRWGQMR